MKTTNNKMKLMGGASTALLATLISSQAVAQTVEIGSTVTVSSVDSTAGSNQAVTKSVEADVTDAQTTKDAGAVTDGSIAIQNNNTGASAVGNTDTLSLSDTDGAVNSTSSSITARQSNTGPTGEGATDIAVDADTTNTLLSVDVGATTGGNYGIKDSTDAATATGNTVAQSLTLSATTLTLGTANATADTVGSPDLDASGKAIAASLQLNTRTDISATNSGSTIEVDAGDASSSALYVSGNTQDAAATGSTATNGLTLSGTTVGAGAVIVAQQENDASSTVTAATTASTSLTAASLGTGASAKVLENDVQARATGVTTTNTMSVDATSVTLAAADGNAGASIDGTEGTIVAAYGTLNDQLVSGSVDASVTGEASGSAIGLSVTGAVTGGSSVQNDSNTVLARAQGATTTNTTTLNVGGTITQGTSADPATDIANVVTIANVQAVADSTDVTSSVSSTSADTIATSVGGALTSSSVSTSSNRLQATSEGATATNRLTASATTFTLGADSSGVPKSDFDSTDAVATADSAFSIANVQDGGNGTVSAKLLEPATVATSVTGAVTASSIAANGNGLDAFATSNKASNTLALSGTTVTTDAGIVSAQSSNSDVLSTIGYDAEGVVGAAASDAGVTVDLANSVDDSTISVNSNVTRGSAIANTSVNTLSATANTLSGDGTDAQANATGDNTGDVTATGDYSLANSQILESSSSSTTKIAASYGIDQADDKALTDSRLSVSSNVQFGEALGNSATNRISLNATDAGAGIDPTASLSNVQDGDTANVEALSTMSAFSNAAADNSSIALNGNSNTSLGVINNASNTIAVNAVKLDGSADKSLITTSTDTIAADYALGNIQSAGGDLDSTATTTLFNTDKNDANTTLGTEDSRVAINSNSTLAEASANRVANAVQISALDNGATAALGNSQTSSATVDATAKTTASFTMNTADGTTAVDGSSVNMDGNATTALARGNSANNALTYTVGATYSGNTSAGIAGTATATATALVLNDQVNTGAIKSVADQASYAIALNGAGESGVAASGSAFSNSNNAVNALAYGNSAVNTLNMATFGAGLPSSAVSSIQSNGGAVLAQATSVQFSMTATGSTTGSVMRSTGNSVTAQAVGNSSVSTIGGGGI